MDVTDINGDLENELIMISSGPSGNTAQLKWLDADSTMVSGPVLELTENTADIVQLIYGKINNDTTAVYLDSYINTNTIITEILCSDTYNNTIYLKSATASNSDSEQINKTIRKSSLLSRDIDNDGIIEIPINTVFKGYEEKPETEQIPMTNWYVFEDNLFVKKYSSYYSITDGYAFMLPDKWIDKVTVKSTNDDITFCSYDEKEENQRELIKICVANSSEAEEIMQGTEYKHYVQIHSYGDTVYLVCIPETYSDPLALTESELLFYFKIIL